MLFTLPNLPGLIAGLAALVLALTGPIPQFADYHAFADTRAALGVANAADVFSNLAFLVAGAWLGVVVWRARAVLGAAGAAWGVFALAVIACGVGSGWYHLAPDDARLVWDRLPIALACAGLIAALRNDTYPGERPRLFLAACLVFAGFSVGWWALTAQLGADDLRPYLLLQTLPLVAGPIWLALRDAPRFERRALYGAIGLYAAAKCAELADHAIFGLTGAVSGHTLKHLFSAAAVVVLAAAVARRARLCHPVSPRNAKGVCHA